MSDRIRVTCEHCNSVIKAPRESAGRTGKCPHCQNPVYVPIPQEELEEIPLAPDEDSALAKADQLEKEAYEIAADIRRERQQPAEPGGADSGTVEHSDPQQKLINIGEAIIRYLLAMEISDLQKADSIVGELKAASRQTKSKVQQMMVDAMKPEAVRRMPDGLYQGFLRKLLDQL